MDIEYRSGLVALIGEANTGKSTLLNMFLGKKLSIVTPKPQTTRNPITGIKTTEAAQMVFVDTPGFVRAGKNALNSNLKSIAERELGEADVRLLILDAAKLTRTPDALEATKKLFRSNHWKLPSLIALNKVDLLESQQVLLPLIATVHEVFGCEQLVPISAKTGEGIPQLERVVQSMLPVGPQLFPEDVATDQTEEFFVSEIVREKLMLFLQQELPYVAAVVVDKYEDEGSVVRVHASIVVERDAQKRIVVGKGGEMIKKVGTAARKELERLFAVKVYLELFVRVEPGWTNSPRGLKRVGLTN